MKILFVHQNAPGQFRHLAPHLARDECNEVVFLGEGNRPKLPGVQWQSYHAPQPAGQQTHHYLRRAEACVRRGQVVARALIAMREKGFEPDLVIGHPGWGETMFLREVLPKVKFLAYCELFYQSEGQDTGYVPETAIDLDGRCRIRVWNADLLTSLSIMDHGISPTVWQRDQHPEIFRKDISVMHEGIDVEEVTPNPAARFVIPDGPTFVVGDEVITFVARDLEPVRGFALLMQALPELLRLRPEAHVVICGGDGVSYGRQPSNGGTWKEHLLDKHPVDLARVHFVGRLPRSRYLSLLHVSALHLYLSVPFVLSWSCIEAMAAACLLLASDVAPVREAIEDGRNGFLVDAREPGVLARRAAELLASRRTLEGLRREARSDAVAKFELNACLAVQTDLISRLMK